MNDPWADDPYAPNEAPPPNPWDEGPAAGPGFGGVQYDQPNSEEINVTGPINVSAEGKLTVTLKRDGGYDSPWLVIRGDSAGEIEALLTDVRTNDLLNKITFAAKAFGGTKQGGAPAPQAAPQQPVNIQQTQQFQQQAPQQPQYQQPQQGGGQQGAPTWGDGRHCPHGQMIPKEGLNKWNKPYQAYFCPTPKGTPNQCPAQFV